MGGAQKYVLDLASGLLGEYQTAIASGDGEGLGQAAAAAGIPYYRLSRLKRDIHPIQDALSILEIARLVKKLGADAVHLNSSKAMIVGGFGAKLGGAKTVISTMHGLVLTEPLPPLKKLIYCLAEKLSAPFQDALIAVSDSDRAAALKYRLKPADKIFTIPNGVNPESLNFLSAGQARSELQKFLPPETKNKKIAITVADHYYVKGLAYLAEALAGIKTEERPVVVNFARPGPATADLGRKLDALNLRGHFFILNLPKPEKFLKAADIYVIPSLKEGLPYALLFAALAELPIVASSTGGIPDVVKNEASALLVSPGDAKALGSAIERMLADRDLSRHLAAGARLAVKNFTLQKMLADTQKLYKKLLSEANL